MPASSPTIILERLPVFTGKYAVGCVFLATAGFAVYQGIRGEQTALIAGVGFAGFALYLLHDSHTLIEAESKRVTIRRRLLGLPCWRRERHLVSEGAVLRVLSYQQQGEHADGFWHDILIINPGRKILVQRWKSESSRPDDAILTNAKLVANALGLSRSAGE